MRISVSDNAGDQWLFDWEPSTAELSGPDGWWIDRLMQLWGRLAALAGADPTAIDPRHSRAGMACFLVAHEFRLPDELCTDLSPCFWMVWGVRRRAAVRPRRFRLIRNDPDARPDDSDDSP
jgi:hypothetical protein